MIPFLAGLHLLILQAADESARLVPARRRHLLCQSPGHVLGRAPVSDTEVYREGDEVEAEAIPRILTSLAELVVSFVKPCLFHCHLDILDCFASIN
jgi:hypothetical protein